jgi:nucleoid-associated protein YgaU
MISRPALIGVVGAIVVLAAVVLNYFISDEAPSDSVAAPPVATAPTEPQEQASAGGTEGEKPAAAAPVNPAPQSPIANERTDAPVFNVVRVDPDGNTVIAGRARPNSKVQILEGGRVIGEVTADGRGDWVFVPEKRLEPGSRILTLSTTNDSGERLDSENAVVLVIPEAGKNIAGDAASGDRTPLAMVVPRDQASAAPSRVIQAPKSADATAREEGTFKENAPGSGAPAVRSFPESSNTPGTAEQVASGTATADAKGPVALDTVDYDDKGEVVFSGRAAPGDRVQVYVDNKLVGDAVADAQGRWTLTPDGKLAPGQHDIRVDKVAETGKVLARIELPFVRAKPFSGLPAQTVVVIQSGNNLWRIAARVYGDGMRYTDIFQANADQIRNPDLIYPGQVFGLPKTN